MKEIDVRHLACPGPVLKLRELLDAGENAVRFRVADELSRSNVTRFAASRGARSEVEEDGDGGFFVAVTAGEASTIPGPGEEKLLACDLPEAASAPGDGPLVVQVTAETMGSGDDELGALLMRAFLKTQAQLEQRPETILFYNTGVKLCCEGSLLIDDLKGLQAAGIDIIACGTCLNFFQLADQLAVGRGTDMLEMATHLATAGRIVRP